MRHIRRNIVLRVFMVLCAVAQVVAVMPHHHHESSGTACINPLHCLADSHTHEHNASETGGDNCPEPGCADCPGHTGGSVCHDGCSKACTSHKCLHNTSGHRHSGNGSDCDATHLDLNPPARDEITLTAPVLWLAGSDYDLVTAEPVAEPTTRGIGEITTGSVYYGTLALFPSFIASAIPPRAPSVLA